MSDLSNISRVQSGNPSGAAFEQVTLNTDTNTENGSIGGHDVAANAEGAEPPRTRGSVRRLIDNFFSGIKNRYERHVMHSRMAKINVQMPEDIAAERQQAREAAGQQVEQHGHKYDAERMAYISKNTNTEWEGEGDSRKLVTTSTTRDIDLTLISMFGVKNFGEDDAALADALLTGVVENEAVSKKLDRFLLRHGSFELVDNVADDHFAYDSDRRVIQISGSILSEANTEQLIALLDANLEIVDFFTLLVGADEIAAHHAALEAETARKADLAHPKTDLTRTAPDLFTFTRTISGTGLEVHPAIDEGRNREALYDLIGDRTDPISGVIDWPSENQLLLTAMFGNEGSVMPYQASLQPILADPDLKSALFLFLIDGGTFKTGFSSDGVHYDHKDNTIVVPLGMMSKNPAEFEDAFRNLFRIPQAQVNDQQDVLESEAELPPTTATETVAGTVPRQEEGSVAGGATVTDELDIDGLVTEREEVGKDETVTRQDLFNMANREELTPETELDQLSPVEQDLSILRHNGNVRREAAVIQERINKQEAAKDV